MQYKVVGHGAEIVADLDPGIRAVPENHGRTRGRHPRDRVKDGNAECFVTETEHTLRSPDWEWSYTEYTYVRPRMCDREPGRAQEVADDLFQLGAYDMIGCDPCPPCVQTPEQ